MAIKSFFVIVTALGLMAATPTFAGAISAAVKPAPQKMPENGGKVQTRDGYWVECDNVGENCHYVFAFSRMTPSGDPAPDAKRHRVAAKADVKVKDGYWVECDNVGENCHYVFMFAPPAAK